MTAFIATRDLWFSYHGRIDADDREAAGWSLRGVEIEVEPGTSVGLVGESGSGKSTLLRALCGMVTPQVGTVEYEGRSVSDWMRGSANDFRRQNQMVFQSPASSFDPRMRVGASLAEPIRSIERRRPTTDELKTLLGDVGMGSEILDRYPHQLSGGQLQRIAIARALALKPTVLHADEPTSSLDVSVQAQILNLMLDLRQRYGLTLLLVSHDIMVVARMCEHVVVMKDGKVVEQGPTDELIQRPASDWTRTLVAAAEAVALR